LIGEAKIAAQAVRAKNAGEGGGDGAQHGFTRRVAQFPHFVVVVLDRLGFTEKELERGIEILKAFSPCIFIIFVSVCLCEYENWVHHCNSSFGSEHLASQDGCWTLIDAFYFSIITLTTIGYGDVTPSSSVGRAVCAVLMPVAIFALSLFMAQLHHLSELDKMGAQKTLGERLEELQEVIDADDDGTVSPTEYVIFNLKKMGKVDDDTVDLLMDQFDALDADGSGELDREDIKVLREVADQMAKYGA